MLHSNASAMNLTPFFPFGGFAAYHSLLANSNPTILQIAVPKVPLSSKFEFEFEFGGTQFVADALIEPVERLETGVKHFFKNVMYLRKVARQGKGVEPAESKSYINISPKRNVDRYPFGWSCCFEDKERLTPGRRTCASLRSSRRMLRCVPHLR